MIPNEPRATGAAILRLIALSILGVLVICGLALAPTLIWLIPTRVRERPVASAAVLVALSYSALWGFARSSRFPRTRFPRLDRALTDSESIANAILARALVPFLLIVSLIDFLAWLPTFLVLPWSRDSDTFASIAQAWQAGVVPYRDSVGYNFPGHIYLFWLIGSILGWGHTWGLFLFDALFLLLFAAVMLAWSHRIFRTAIPGSICLLLVLLYYTRLDFQVYAQRDWHATLAMASSILVGEAWPTRNGRRASAVLAAIGFSIRPHVVVFLPAIWSAIGESAFDNGLIEPPRRSARFHYILEWSVYFGLFAVLAFVPLLMSGAFWSLIRGLNDYVLSGSYGREEAGIMSMIISDALTSPPTRILLPLLVVTAIFAHGRHRSSARTWLLVVVGAVIYRLPHPVQHNYLSFPYFIMRIIALAPVAAWLLQSPGLPSVSKLAALCALGASSLVFNVDPPELGPAWAAVRSIAAGQSMPPSPPPGAIYWYNRLNPVWYPWKDYRNTLLYLRDHTAADTVVANALRSPPFPPINGPVGRRSPFRAESGICWIWLINEDRDATFARELATGNCDVVVWVPGEEAREPRMELPRLCAAIRESFEPEAQFGRIEIWRRKHRGP